MEQAAVDLNEYCIALLLFGMKEGLTSRESRFDLLVSLFVCALCVLYGALLDQTRSFDRRGTFKL